MSPNDRFKVIVRGSKFTLTRPMVEFDGPNYFTACFLGSFKESQTRTVEIWRDATLFAIVLDYLCGYTVFPLKLANVPSRMTLATAVLNLRADAEFYQLDGLVQACNDQINSTDEQPENKLLVVYGTSPASTSPDIASFLDSYKNHRIAFLPKQKVQQEFPNMTTPQLCSGFYGVRELGGITKIVKSALCYNSYLTSEWKLVGWKWNATELLIVLKKVPF
ncbi:hypothetical protein BDV93DRAFT_558736 [Ceratobasidium sp. AG-I]|nr:hypothetical protein BDV93DRAFT_558736 [Ceratobasidium sp. AG-I]